MTPAIDNDEFQVLAMPGQPAHSRNTNKVDLTYPRFVVDDDDAANCSRQRPGFQLTHMKKKTKVSPKHEQQTGSHSGDVAHRK